MEALWGNLSQSVICHRVIEAAALVPSWPLSAPWRWHVEAHDDGVEVWVDDEAELFSGA